MDIEDIEKAINIIEQNNIPNGKIYLNPSQIEYKKFLEIEGFEVIIVDNPILPSDVNMIYGNIENNKGGLNYEM